MSRKTHPDKRSKVKKSAARKSLGLLARFDRRTKFVACFVLASLIAGVTYASWLPAKSNERSTNNNSELSRNNPASPIKNVATLSANELADIPPEALYPRPPQRAGYNASQGGLPPGALPPGLVLPGITRPLAPSPQGYGVYDGVRHQFTGKERDTETGLDYFGARYYSSAQGRFTSVDPDNASADPADPQSWNGYAYARNNPLAIIDTDGREFQWVNANGEVHYLTDRQFEQAKKDLQAQGLIFKNGKIYAEVTDSDGNTVRTQTGSYMRTDTSAMWDQVAPQLSARLVPVQKVVTVAAAIAVATIAAPIAGLEIGAGGGITALNLATKAAPAAGAGGTVLNQLSRGDVGIFQRAAQLGASASNSFMNNLQALTQAVVQKIPGGQVNVIGRIGNSPVYGGRSGVGIAEVNGVTVVVKMVNGNPKILGPLP